MSLTTFMMQLVISASSLAVMVFLPPAIWMPKPHRTAKTIRGRMALRLHSSTKSGLVKKLIIMSATPRVSPTSPAVASYWPCTRGKMRQTMYMMMAAMPAVTRKVTTVVPMILPAFFAFSILAMAEAMEQKTMGTTIQNIRLINTVPSGSSAVAPGQTAPVIQPATMPTSIHRIKA